MKYELYKKVNRLTNDCMDYFHDRVEYYEKKYSINLDHPKISVYTIDAVKDYSSLPTDFIDQIARSRMLTFMQCCVDSDSIITAIPSVVTMSYQTMFEIIMDCNMSFPDALSYIAYIIKHEIGHIIDRHQRLIGKPIEEWDKLSDKYLDDLAEFYKTNKLRKNSSKEKKLNHLLLYHQLPEEASANKLVGITDHDHINAFRLVESKMVDFNNWRLYERIREEHKL